MRGETGAEKKQEDHRKNGPHASPEDRRFFSLFQLSFRLQG